MTEGEEMDKLKSFPLTPKIKKIFKQQKLFPENWQPTGLTKDIYIKLSEPVVRQAVAWQDKDGRIIDPFEKKETATTTARFAGALGFLISVKHCPDLVDVCVKSMNRACEDLYRSGEKPVDGTEFYVKELMRGYLALKDKVDKSLVKKWEKHLGEYDPEKNYEQVLFKCKPEDIYNFCTFALAGESFKKACGLADNYDFIEKHLENQKRLFTEFGMYRDPNDPITYDYTARMNLSLLNYFGYKGKNSEWLNETLRKGGLTTLFYISSSGEAPYGGRSNQFHFNEATIALICEYEASRYKALGEKEIAGAFKRMARLSALSVKRWLELIPLRFVKNEFPPKTQHGRESSYGYYGVYSLLIASQFGFAHLIADDSIEEKPAPCEIGGYVLELPDAFHKVFATCQGYHVEIDTQADHNYDATGLGRIHKISIPTELGLSCSIVPKPHYNITVRSSPRNIAIGPGWEDAEGNIQWLADLSDEINKVEVKKLKEEVNEVKVKVIYTGRFKNAGSIIESYKLDDTGLEIEDEITGSAKTIMVQVPLIETNGQNNSKIKVEKGLFKVEYMGYLYQVECLEKESVETFLEPFSAPNRNGIYKVGCFKAKANHIKYKVTLSK